MASRDYYKRLTYRAARKYGLDPRIFIRQIKAESDFNPYAGSSAGARGIAQFMPATARELGIDPMDSKQALDGAAKLMAKYVRQYGSYRKALAAYNAGTGAVAKYGGVPPYAETQAYVKKILSGISGAQYPGQKPRPASTAQTASGGSTGAQEQQPISLAATVNPTPQIQITPPAPPQILDTSQYLTNSASGQAPQLPALQNQAPPEQTQVEVGTQAPEPATQITKVADLPPAQSSSGIARLVSRMDRIDGQRRSYLYGGGHGGGLSIKNAKPIDCSAAVSLALNIPVRVSGDFGGWGKAGKSKRNNAVNVYYNAGHVLMSVVRNGVERFWGTSRSNPGGGAGWIPRSALGGSYLSAFKVRHMVM